GSDQTIQTASGSSGHSGQSRAHLSALRGLNAQANVNVVIENSFLDILERIRLLIFLPRGR
ncbi:hypothetical protein DVA81_19225, partial [Acinetobacter baumannii]